MDETVFVHIVSHNSERYLKKAVESVLGQTDLKDLHLHITDNASSDTTREILRELESSSITVACNNANLGFCGAHNQGVKIFLDGTREYLLILNPDVVLESRCIANLIKAKSKDSAIGLLTPKLYRADENLDPVSPRVLDAAGMILVDSLRHFDRGSQEPDGYNSEEFIFGGTGACLLLTRKCVKNLLLKGEKFDSLKSEVFPLLSQGEEERAPLFDEGFFAYREDADLSWRANLSGFKCLYVPQAAAYHKRVVLPGNRSSTTALLKGLSVRNRFLLQLNNYFIFNNSAGMFFTGFLLRNILVLLGVLLTEWSSFPYLIQGFALIPRALERRRILWSRMHER